VRTIVRTNEPRVVLVNAKDFVFVVCEPLRRAQHQTTIAKPQNLIAIFDISFDTLSVKYLLQKSVFSLHFYQDFRNNR
jgi:hypothetical protein